MLGKFIVLGYLAHNKLSCVFSHYMSCLTKVARTERYLIVLKVLKPVQAILGILLDRWTKLYTAMGMKTPDAPNLTRYYALVNVPTFHVQHFNIFVATLSSRSTAWERIFRLACS